ncbi:GtrA family protein [Fluviibacterium sp. DFM31]|uniref:GtrA family protein n=1 Tax=Meridianimarinicoccus marinus TaxID=3231483 RepID=A0ABV3L552_9RHOB
MIGDLLRSRFVKFLAVGVLNTGFGYALYAVLVLLGLGPQAALALAFACGVVWNYFTHARLVFSAKGTARMPAYAAVYAGLYALNAAGLAGLLRLGMGPIVAQAVLVLPAAALSFIAISKVLTDRFPWEGRPA